MPYSGINDPNLPEHVQELSADKRRQWIAVFEQVLDDTGDEGEAMQAANAAVKHGDLLVALGGACKALSDADDGRFGGHLIMWGNEHERDLQGEFFTPDTDLSLDWFDRRPVLYHHGLDQAVRAKSVGFFDTLKTDDVGLWIEGQLDLRNRWARAVWELVKRGALGLSSGSLAHLVDIASNGHIRFWPLVEGSTTPAPAEPRIQVMPLKALQDLGLPGLKGLMTTAGVKFMEVDAPDSDNTPSTDPDGADRKTPPAPPDDSQPEDSEMNLEHLIAQIMAQVAKALGGELTDEQQQAITAQVMADVQPAPDAGGDGANPDTDDVGEGDAPEGVDAPDAAPALDGAELGEQVATAVVKAVTTLLNGQRAADSARKHATDLLNGMTPQSQAPPGQRPRPGAADLEVRTKFHYHSAEDMSFFAWWENQRRRKNHLPPFVPDQPFVRELADKAGKAYTANEIQLEPEAVKFFRAIKSDELVHTTQSGYGQDWIHTVWSNQLWEKARMDNPIMGTMRVEEMPANTWTLPLEAGDPTVYYVPETQHESDLTLSGAGNPIPDSKIGTGKVTLTAKKLALRVAFSSEEEEDSIVPFAPQARMQAIRALEDALDNVLVNGDIETGSTNVNYDGASPTGNERWLAFDGFIKLALVTDSKSVSAAGAAPTLAMLRENRFNLDRAKTRVDQLVAFTHTEVEQKLLGMSEFLTRDKASERATAFSGVLGEADGVPILLTNELQLSASNGKVHNSTGNTYGRVIHVHLPSWVVGFRRRVTPVLEYISYYDSYMLTATIRLDLARNSANCASVLYYINVA